MPSRFTTDELKAYVGALEARVEILEKGLEETELILTTAQVVIGRAIGVTSITSDYDDLCTVRNRIRKFFEKQEKAALEAAGKGEG